MPTAEQQPPQMNTLQHINPKTERQRRRSAIGKITNQSSKMQSGALMRRDQELKQSKSRSGRFPLPSRQAAQGLVGPKGTAHSGKPNEFGTIGASLSRPTT